MDDVRITSAKKRDIDAIYELELASFPAPWRREFFESELRATGRLSLVARRGHAVIGYLFAMWFFDEMHVNKIAVAESERRRQELALDPGHEPDTRRVMTVISVQ